ncbi:hypothetical protein N7540_012499 [Penicillium herquei]|nr:hypothetical protein N7540_012499 [Penicillium herquei]
MNSFLSRELTKTMRVESDNLPAAIERFYLHTVIAFWISLGQNQFELAIFPSNDSYIAQYFPNKVHTNLRFTAIDPLFLSAPGESCVDTMIRELEVINSTYKINKEQVKEAPAQVKHFRHVLEWLEAQILHIDSTLRLLWQHREIGTLNLNY